MIRFYSLVFLMILASCDSNRDEKESVSPSNAKQENTSAESENTPQTPESPIDTSVASNLTSSIQENVTVSTPTEPKKEDVPTTIEVKPKETSEVSSIIPQNWMELRTTNWSFRYPAEQNPYLFNGGIQNAWIVKPYLSGMSKGELIKLSNQYTEMDCDWIFSQVQKIEDNSSFFISESIESIGGVSKVESEEGKHTDIQFAIKDKKSGKCLGVFFYTNEFYSEWITLNEDSEISLSIKKIMSSIVKL